MQLNRTMILGISVSGAAWFLLVWSIITPDPLLRILGQTGTALGQHYLVTLFECALFTGFVVILVGALQAGFGALDRFFDAILRRSGKNEQLPPPPRRVVAESKSPQAQVSAVQERPVLKSRLPPKVMDEGFLRGRTYALYSDGSVEVDTLLGRKKFESMDAAITYLGVDGNVLRKVA